MRRLRVGTRGSDLALAQTRWVCEQLRVLGTGVEIEEVVIRTSGDDAVERRADDEWPVGAFVGAIERALLAGEVDFAVHSYKDLPTSPTGGLAVVAVPEREAAHDVLVTRASVDLCSLPKIFRVGTGSPRRAAQLRRIGDVQIVPIRGNVPARVAKVDRGELDAIVLAAAGLRRLNLNAAYCVSLPLDRFPPAPGQGALAVQSRSGDGSCALLSGLEHTPSRRAVDAERAFLHGIGAGCRTAAAAYAWLDADVLTLHAQLFNTDGSRMVEAWDVGSDPSTLGARVAASLQLQLVESP